METKMEAKRPNLGEFCMRLNASRGTTKPFVFCLSDQFSMRVREPTNAEWETTVYQGDLVLKHTEHDEHSYHAEGPLTLRQMVNAICLFEKTSDIPSHYLTEFKPNRDGSFSVVWET
jgi:hypothetical protein